ncbi:ATP-dependent RNA helicase RhlE [Pontiella desulfatans]|uniref:ATP-dependent RNA helicase RhlE n=1 Tax=Pontiella desulfatans TaxID=2750659 RepID=A0A6C2TVG3_PONDE|nr:DEAD/DEAH box helicase [Pontiella desulfatans]VGO11630.1 ATP-dependent RNA helicase RhlE [Pontiella desulfatans]
MQFSHLIQNEEILRAIADAGFTEPTPIQAKAIPAIQTGRDIIGCARTGTGKTAAFALPLIQRLLETWTAAREIRVRSLILSPTRELAIQLQENIRKFSAHTDLTTLLVHGGTEYENQILTLREGVDILIATPGRMLDLIDRKALRLDQVEIFVVDEADRMLDMGFAPDIRKIAPMLPQTRQALFFSATMPREALSLATGILHKPMHISSDPVSAAAENIEKSLYYVEKNNKNVLLSWLLQRLEYERILIFCRTRRGADRLTESMKKQHLPVDVLHGEKEQRHRQNILEAFKSGETPVLIATDLAARGIDIENISHIINFDLPNEPETFVHRIGRTARAGASGKALTFCDPSEKGYLRDILAHLNEDIEVVDDHPFHSEQVKNYSGNVKSKHTPDKQKHVSRIREQTTWRLTPGEQNKLHAKPDSPKKNARRNPKKKK